jgi:predicted PurR-regulated permease PerM
MRRSRSSASRNPDPKGSDSRKLNRTFFLLVLAGATGLVFFVARFFLVVLLLSALSAGIFHPVHARLRRRLPRPPWLTATVSTVVFCLIILIPVGVLGYFTVSSLIEIANQALGQHGELLSRLRHFETALGNLPLFDSGPLKNLLSSDRMAQLLQNAASWVLRQVTGLVENVVRSILMLFVYLYSLYFFIKDGERILRGIADAIPLPEDDKLAVGRSSCRLPAPH